MSIELEYKLNLIVELLTVLLNLVGSIFVLSLFYKNEFNLGGWDWGSSLIVLGFYTLLESFTAMLLQPNLNRIVRQVQTGTLDFILLKPFPSQIWLSFRLFSPWGIPSFISGLILILVGLNKTHTTPSLSLFILSTAMLFSGLIILYSLWFMLATTSIWFVKVWNANEVLRSTLLAGRYPVSAYPNILRSFFTFVLPIAFLTTVPAKALLGSASSTWLLSSILISTLFLIISNRLWNYALSHYTSASS